MSKQCFMICGTSDGIDFSVLLHSHRKCFPLTAASSNLLKYRALYEFVARNSDELSFQPGDVIMVSFIVSPCFVKKESA